MKNHTYGSVDINELDVEKHRRTFEDDELVVGVDVAKHEMYAGLGDATGEVHRIVRWSHPEQSREGMDRLERLGACRNRMVMEPTGTYGAALATEATRRGWTVHSIQPKRVKDAAEVYDGVPSQHDAKAAVILVWLDSQGIGSRRRSRTELDKELRARMEPVRWLREDKQRYEHRLSSKLVKFWPEVTSHLETDSATLLGILEEYGGPGEVAQRPNEVKQRMREIGGHLLKEETIRRVIEGASRTMGEPMVQAQRQGVKNLARRVNQVRRERREARREVVRWVKECPGLEGIRRLGGVVGKYTAAVMWDELGDVRTYGSPDQLVKALGLNLKEKSSGKHQGELKITKRGSSRAREVLYLATWRKINRDRWFGRWHEKKMRREGNKNKNKSVVALMRKLAKGLWHVARGKEFDSSKLFEDGLVDQAA